MASDVQASAIAPVTPEDIQRVTPSTFTEQNRLSGIVSSGGILLVCNALNLVITL